MSGLLGISTPPNFRIEVIEGKGRGLILQEAVTKGAFVVEYEADVYPRREWPAREEEYIANGEGCYVMDVQTSQGWMCFDATRRFLSPGRLMNHARRCEATLTPFKPVLLGGKWRVGFLASRDLQPGEELTWDYGCSPGGIHWLNRRLKKATIGEHKNCALHHKNIVHVFVWMHHRDVGCVCLKLLHGRCQSFIGR